MQHIELDSTQPIAIFLEGWFVFVSIFLLCMVVRMIAIGFTIKYGA